MVTEGRTTTDTIRLNWKVVDTMSVSDEISTLCSNPKTQLREKLGGWSTRRGGLRRSDPIETDDVGLPTLRITILESGQIDGRGATLV